LLKPKFVLGTGQEHARSPYPLRSSPTGTLGSNIVPQFGRPIVV
jgi:hypothetical protein